MATTRTRSACTSGALRSCAWVAAADSLADAAADRISASRISRRTHRRLAWRRWKDPRRARPRGRRRPEAVDVAVAEVAADAAAVLAAARHRPDQRPASHA